MNFATIPLYCNIMVCRFLAFIPFFMRWNICVIIIRWHCKCWSDDISVSSMYPSYESLSCNEETELWQLRTFVLCVTMMILWMPRGCFPILLYYKIWVILCIVKISVLLFHCIRFLSYESVLNFFSLFVWKKVIFWKPNCSLLWFWLYHGLDLT